MAATPPMPPGSNTHQLNGKPNGKGNPLTEAINQHFQRKNQNQSLNQSTNPNQNPSPSSTVSCSRSGSNEQLELLEHPSHPQDQQQEANGGKAKPSCHCTNISIMHLFHEMKQEFPTIPDAIVTQCVNENCHQRDNCIQMLRKELALHPIPVQSYPAKVLQQQQQQQHHQNRQAKPPTPLKPSRVAPTHPEVGQCNGVATPPAVSSSPHPNPQPRPRPTTLNLQRQFSTQLQQKIQQRQQRQQRDNHPPQLTPTSLSKPLRRAPPLPPPPKPKPGSFSNDSSCLTSPMSSSESELSLNAVSLSSPTSASAATTAVQGASTAIASAQQQQPSPVRHRSVITLQPEPPYARDFRSIDFPPATTTTATPPLPSPSSAASPGAAGGRKSFTSLNLTLRQPTGSAQSAIDITAGPAPSGQGSGITYSSVSFDARRGTHKNFQLTVTDEGSVFSAGCIRPRTAYAAPCEPVASVPANQQPPPPAAVVADGLGEAEMTPDVFPYPTQEQNHIVASNYNNNHAVSSNNNNSGISNSVDSSPTMPLYEGVMEECDREAHAATIERQKQRRDKLANALRDNKKRLLVLEQEINILTEPVPVGESERLDRDIMRLTEDCKRLLDCINEPQANGPGPAASPMSRQHLSPASNAPQQQPQPFPRQRQGARVQAPPSSLRLHSVPAAPTAQPVSLDFGQHHSSAPSSACLTPQQQSHQQQFQMQQEPPPTYAQYYQFQQYLQQQRQQQLHQQQLHQQQLQHQQQMLQQQPPIQPEEEFLSDSEVDEEEETLDSWACNMCTFRNHPQLNICEACENVRIQPGMIRIVPSGGGAAAAAATSPGSLEQQQQPPQQPYALHT
ncbi:putative uncharacterized protein DDB_G0271606 isoform X2 [Drosophila biarmipes]|uniref:putative uncharacterized protein DDB_G0271606 isoform X2 n=1 Tax=Drosophila biarmipes TaxID=125945 RepID=UPI0021CC9982|nr:putative uncharacterized protein DDB_G0271606 isoform X2 [Drosophila biarmipes]